MFALVIHFDSIVHRMRCELITLGCLTMRNNGLSILCRKNTILSLPKKCPLWPFHSAHAYTPNKINMHYEHILIFKSDPKIEQK